ncbi:C40 family peptidase [Cohnella sp. GCM10027633]|uniref:C40 family peptidase n=1 Tax=unclassified Cohnella TaxID=2636738 RepID=UPI00363DB8D0
MTNSIKKRPIWRRALIAATCCAVLLTGAAVASQPVAHAATTKATASATSAQKKAAIVSKAQSLVGKVKYKYGVNNPSKLWFDCSSFTKYVFASQGIGLKWGTASQSKQGVYVSKSNLRKGDLVFFSVGTPGKIGHVGIYMGNGKFIHNTIGSNFNGVTISNLSAYGKRYITARRVG